MPSSPCPLRVRPADCRLTTPGGLRRAPASSCRCVLSRVFRGKFVAGLRELHAAGKLGFHGGLVGCAGRIRGPAARAVPFRLGGVLKRPFGEHALRYRPLHAPRGDLESPSGSAWRMARWPLARLRA